MIVAGREVGRKLDPIPCASCGVEFVPDHRTQRYCCPSCKAQGKAAYAVARSARRSPKIPIPCKHCGVVFTPFRKSKVFCCAPCKYAYWGKIHNDARNEKARAIKIERREELEKAESDRIAARNAKAEAARIAKEEAHQRVCQFSGCGAHFIGHRNRMYCSTSCSYKAEYQRIRVSHLAKEKAATAARALKRPVVTCAHHGCNAEFRQSKSTNVFCDAHTKRAQRSNAAKRGSPPTPTSLTVDPDAVKRRLADQGLIVAPQAAEASNSVKSCLDRRGLKCRKYLDRDCFDVRHHKLCGKTL